MYLFIIIILQVNFLEWIIMDVDYTVEYSFFPASINSWRISQRFP